MLSNILYVSATYVSATSCLLIGSALLIAKNLPTIYI